MIAARRAQELADAKALAEKLASVEISIPMQATDDEQLFGSVTARMIAEELASQGFAIPHSKITVEPAIKTLGSFEVAVKLHAEVAATVKVWVVRG
jgi:large subunit ribosomal protein L9